MALINNFTSTSLCLLLIVVSLQISQLSGQSLEVSASGSACIQDCGPGFRCVSGRCERRNCNRDCTGKAEDQVCGSNGVTYRNRCEMAKAQCQLATQISFEYSGPCITLPPPPDNLCKAHQRRWDTMSLAEYMAECDYMEIKKKADNGTLQLSDVLPCYRPQCSGEAYITKQCSFNAYNWCWCSTSDGFAIEGTLERNKPEGACDARRTCEMDGIVYDDGALFSPATGCGFCECLNGDITCFEEYVPEVNGQLNSTQLAQLKQEVVQLFYFQYNHDEHVLVDIRHIHQHPSEVTGAVKQNVLRWKFNYYDRNNDEVLHPAEEFIFQTELYEFVRCKSFFDHVSQLIDEDNSGTITLDEWNRFFESETSGSSSGSSNGLDVSGAGSSNTAKRSVRAAVPQLRKPLKLRKKFRYVLF